MSRTIYAANCQYCGALLRQEEKDGYVRWVGAISGDTLCFGRHNPGDDHAPDSASVRSVAA